MTGEEREKWIRKNAYYHRSLVSHLKFIIPEGSSVLEIGCGTGYLLEQLRPSRGVGIDVSEEMIRYARIHRPANRYFEMNAEHLTLDETFDYVVISDTIGSFRDVQMVFEEIHKAFTPQTRLIITSTNFIWRPILNLAEKLSLKMPQKRQNWLDISDIVSLLNLSDFELIGHDKKMIFPKYIPLLSAFLNRYVANLPLINALGLITCLVARSNRVALKPASEMSVSVIIPARNEKGNIEALIQRTPTMGRHTELIFIEGNSTDQTWEEIQRLGAQYKEHRDIQWAQQAGKGKGDAVRKGYSMATGDILMILDADMTVAPEELPKFFNAIASGKGEYINGSRLVYPMEKQAMRFLNLLGNKFFSLAFSWLLGQNLKDTLCGTKVISRENYLKLAANRSYFGDFDPFGDFDLIFGSAKLNLKFVEIPIRYRARTYGETNISRFKHGWLLLRMTAFAVKKIKFT
ncbi:bifunctional class I SAM-dependent methyltransferase/glycosyltransferase family 2 protein [Dyadobacter sp. CY347]|uniref:bifunctional class I SAM-dependent methyltransferase/glycosyltransferase family 2 protein n=1 Tax=Dyadobacter sp. CY347 TaxID=2909336 RepID=UPI001F342C24|nr:bifunctional class I SAM-dependent methyltransferase/glycosyltransferase family 2 protein [Dyadobacter sp. CY347]MCF2489341.1 bifunctional class I SAM-dependent methyltransferase/glycosyltransferase family 2 protein [Dyadobacter sp. CY347]